MQQTETSDMPRAIERFDDDDSPWYEHDGELLFGDDTELVRDKVQAMCESDYGRYSPKNGFSQRTKIRTTDSDEFTDELVERLNECNETFIFGEQFIERVDVHKKGPQRTDVSFRPSFGYPASLGGAAYRRNQILLEVKRYETDLFWNEILEPLFNEYNEKYPY